MVNTDACKDETHYVGMFMLDKQPVQNHVPLCKLERQRTVIAKLIHGIPAMFLEYATTNVGLRMN